jgi:hypothetical protein
MFSVFFPNKISMESVKAEERRAAGRRFGPEAVTEHEAGLIWETHARTVYPPASRRCHPPAIQIHSLDPDLQQRAANGHRIRFSSVRRATLKCASTL